jgi:hypothetical protein
MTILPDSNVTELTWQSFTEANLFVPPPEWHFAGAKADLACGQLNVHIGNHPMVDDLRRIPTDALTEKQRKDVLSLRKGYELWAVTFSVGVVSTSELWSLGALGLKVAYSDTAPQARSVEMKPIETGIAIIDALPQTQFITVAEGCFSCNAEIGFDGRFEVPKVDLPVAEVPLSIDGKIIASPNIKMAGQVKFAVKSAIIHTIGEGSDFGQWEVKKHEQPLLGTNYFQHVLRLPGDTVKIYATLSVAAVVRGFFRLPGRVESASVTLPISPNSN